MTIEDPVLPIGQWLLGTLLWFVPLLLAVFLVLAMIGYLIFAIWYGPIGGLRHLLWLIRTGLAELSQFSFRRTWAMARLAFQEAIRRKVLVAFFVFVLIMLFASWYLDVESDSPAKLYIAVVLGWSNLLVLMLALFLSTFSLPGDIKNRTIYTVVTKPVRFWELIVGRILGFMLIGTLILALMCAGSYAFVVRGLSHRHVVEADSLVEDPKNVDEDGNLGQIGQTSLEDFHRHTVYINPDQETGFTDVQKGHRHRITKVDGKYRVGPPVGALEARVPIYGTLRFLDRAGKPTDKGINVGNEWAYRSYIEGGSLGAAIWTFDGVSRRTFPESQFPKGIPMELTLRVFRTYKGDVEEGITGSIEIVEYLTESELADGKVPLVSEPINFEAQEYTVDRRYIPLTMSARRGAGPLQDDLELFEDFVHDGKLVVRIRCLERNQYFGAAKPDVYLRAGVSSFGLNFIKGYASIWFQMVLIICFGVTFSTFLSGPIAMLATAMAYTMGYFSQFVTDVSTGKQEGGGPLEAFIRIVEQQNLITDIDKGVADHVIFGFDNVMMLIMRAFSMVMPSYSRFDTASYVANGYNIPADLVTQHILVTLAYFLVLSVIGYFVFKSREIAA